MNKSPRNYSKDRYSNPPTDRNDRFQREQRDNRDSREMPERERDTRDNRSYRRDDDTYNQRNQRGDNRSNYNSSNSGRPNRNRNNNRYGSDRKNPASNFYDTPIRLNRLIAMSGFCSRRKADEFIESGSVKVNGIVVTDLGVKVHPREDRVEFKGQVIKPERPVYIILNKPKNAITTVTDPEGRPTVMDFVRNVGNFRIFPVGRLDRNTTGLLLMTNDGEMARVLTHPSYEISKVYRVLLDKELSQGDLKKLLIGLDLEDGVAKIDKIAFSEKSTERSEVLVQIHSGRNRVIRRMFEALGYSVRSLDRISFGPLTKKNVARGRWRYLTPKEVSFLKMTTATAKRQVGGGDASFTDDKGYGDTEYNPVEEYNFLPEGGGSEDFDFDFNQYADGQSSDAQFSESELDALNEMAYEDDSEYNSASFQQSREQREKQAAQRTQRRPFQNRTQNTGGRTHSSYPPRDNNNRGNYGGPRSNNRNTYGGPRENNYSSGDRPSRPYQNRENNYSSGDRPNRPYQNRENNYSSGDRPNRPYQNRENNYSSGDRPNRPYQNRENNYSSGDRPNRPYQNRENNYSSGDRPNRPYQNKENNYSSGDRPNRPYQNRENNSFSGDRRSQSHERRNTRNSSGQNRFTNRNHEDRRNYIDNKIDDGGSNND